MCYNFIMASFNESKVDLDIFIPVIVLHEHGRIDEKPESENENTFKNQFCDLKMRIIL